MVELTKLLSGNGRSIVRSISIKYILECLSVPYNAVHLEHNNGLLFLKEAWSFFKFTLGLDFPNLIYVIHGGLLYY